MVVSCSPKKNTKATRFYHALTTRFNVYFNGNENFKESLKTMQKDFQDDYTALVHIHPVSAYANEKEQKPTGDFKIPIDKGKKAIQLHSIKKQPKRDPKKASDPKYKAFLNREEFNPYIHNAWFMIAKSQFYKGEFLEAASTFNYIIQHFSWLDDLVKESKIWLMRSYVELGWMYEAEDVKHKISLDSIPEKMLGELSMVTAQFHIAKGDYEEAIPYLEKSIESQKDKYQKIRQTFLLAQLYQKLEQNKNAYDTYSEVISMNPVYRTEFNARIKQTEVMTNQDTAKVIKGLKKMAKASRNNEYLDQIYYAIGNIHLSAGDTLKAIDYYEKANAESTRNGIEKAINQITLGNIYFAQRKYTKAQPCYAEGVPLVSEDYPNYAVLLKRSEVLDDLVVHSSTVELQDSLRYVASLPEEEIMKLIEKKIEEVKEQERLMEEEMARQEHLANQSAMNSAFGQSSLTGAQAPTGPGMQIGGRSTSWYFYNKATVATGKTDFQRKWGKRKLEDNWRRINKAAFSMSDFEEYDYGAEEEAEALADSLSMSMVEGDTLETQITDLKDPRYYLQQLPRTPEDIALSDELIIDGLYNMGVVLKNDLEDYDAAMAVFSRLMTQYPDNSYMLDTYYNIYLMNMITQDKLEAEEYRVKILETFPDSKYAQAMKDPNYLENIKQMEVEQDSLYCQVYETFTAGDNASVHEQYNSFVEKYPLSKYMSKFMLVNALAYVNEGDVENFKEAIKQLLQNYPEEDVAPLATSMLKGVAEGRQVVSGTAKHDIFKVRMGIGGVAPDSVAEAQELPPFVWDKDAPHEMLMVFSTDSIDANQILFMVARYNFSNFFIKDFDLAITTTEGVGMLRISGFDNLRELTLYRRKIETSDGIELPEGVRIVMISSENYNILMQGNTFENYFEFWEKAMAEDAELETNE
jgi:tetratricopeptide (TPR) repeat protein